MDTKYIADEEEGNIDTRGAIEPQSKTSFLKFLE